MSNKDRKDVRDILMKTKVFKDSVWKIIDLFIMIFVISIMLIMDIAYRPESDWKIVDIIILIVLCLIMIGYIYHTFGDLKNMTEYVYNLSQSDTATWSSKTAFIELAKFFIKKDDPMLQYLLTDDFDRIPEISKIITEVIISENMDRYHNIQL